MIIQCPNCLEKSDRELIRKNSFRCPHCKFSFENEETGVVDDFDELIFLDMISDGEIDGVF